MKSAEKWKIWIAASFVVLMGFIGITAGYHYSLMMIGSAVFIYVYLELIAR